jgi:hypothetical protein
MSVTRHAAVRLTAALAGVGLVVVFGCADPTGLAKRYPVSGTVTYNGKPVEKGVINFISTAADGRAASGDITNGKYSLTTATAGDGAFPGSYKVTVIAEERDTTEVKEISKGGQFRHGPELAKANKEAKQLVPAKYKLPETSDLSAEVKAQSNTNVNFDLKD